MVDNDWGNHHGSRQQFLRVPGNLSPDWPKLDAIVVSTARDAGHLANRGHTRNAERALVSASADLIAPCCRPGCGRQH